MILFNKITIVRPVTVLILENVLKSNFKTALTDTFVHFSTFGQFTQMAVKGSSDRASAGFKIGSQKIVPNNSTTRLDILVPEQVKHAYIVEILFAYERRGFNL